MGALTWAKRSIAKCLTPFRTRTGFERLQTIGKGWHNLKNLLPTIGRRATAGVLMHLITIASGPYVNWIPSLIENRNNYCNKHGYTWQITSDVLPGVHAAFAKIGAILDAFKAGHEQVFWIDADAAITNFEFNIKGLAQAPFVVSRCRTHPICTGVFIAQDHPVIIDFLERMWAEREVHQRPPWEQGVIIR